MGPSINFIRLTMPRAIIVTVLLLISSLCIAFSQRINGRFVSSMYAWQRDDTIGVQNRYTFGYQAAQFDVYQNNISLHTYFQGFTGFGSAVSNGPSVRLYNFYLKASKLANILDVSLGRQPVYAGVGIGTIDGLLSRLQFVNGRVVFLGYAGAVPPPYQKVAVIEHVNNNFMLGGQVIAMPISGGRVSLSYMNRRTEQSAYFAIRQDSLNNAIGTFVTPEPYSDQFVGVDASYRAGAPVSVYGRYEYDVNYKQISRGQIFSRVSVTDQLALTGEYIYRSPRIPFHSYFSIFPRNSVKEIEGGVEYDLGSLWRVFGRFARVSYTFDDNRRYTAGVSGEYGTTSYSGSTGFDGKLNSFSAQLFYPLFKRTFVPTLGAAYADYRLNGDAPAEHAFEGIVGSTVRPVPAFSFDLQLQLLNNRVVEHDVRFFARIVYWFSEQLKLFQ
jgi:hypothetical protein